MGHASVGNLSKVLLKGIYAKGSTNIDEAVEVAVKKGEVVHSSEREYKDEGTLSYMFEEIVLFYFKNKYIEAEEIEPEQESVYEDFSKNGLDDWSDKDSEAFRSIKWKFAEGKRSGYSHMIILDNFTN